MCLATTMLPKKTEKDIKVYKRIVYNDLNKKYVTPFKLAVIRFEKLNKEVKLKPTFWNEVAVGYYPTPKTKGDIGEYEVGYHAYWSLNDARNNICANEVLIEGVIPAGSMYAKNSHGEIVASQMIYLNKLV